MKKGVLILQNLVAMKLNVKEKINPLNELGCPDT